MLVAAALTLAPAATRAQVTERGAAHDALREGAHHLVVDGVRLWYRVAGHGTAASEPVIFLHGGPGEGSYRFAALAGPSLEPQLRLVYLDQRGSGHSERPWTRDYSIERLVADIDGVRRALGVPKVGLIGHSFGGTLALEYAAAHPDRVTGVVFVAGLWDTGVQGRLRCARTIAADRDAAREALGGESAVLEAERTGDCHWFWTLPNDRRETINNRLMFVSDSSRLRLEKVDEQSGTRNTGELGRGLVERGLANYRFSRIDAIAAAVLVIAGEHDGAATSEGLLQLTRRLPDARFVEIAGTGHFVYMDDPSAFAQEVAQFFGQVGGTPRR